jgi:hypothetical protein
MEVFRLLCRYIDNIEEEEMQDHILHNLDEAKTIYLTTRPWPDEAQCHDKTSDCLMGITYIWLSDSPTVELNNDQPKKKQKCRDENEDDIENQCVILINKRLQLHSLAYIVSSVSLAQKNYKIHQTRTHVLVVAGR